MQYTKTFKKVDMHKQREQGTTVLHLAAISEIDTTEEVEIIFKLAQDNFVDIYELLFARNKDNRLASHEAIKANNFTIANFLLEKEIYYSNKKTSQWKDGAINCP